MSEVDARDLAAALLADDLPRRWRHVRAVAVEVRRLCDTLRLDHTYVAPAAWLHDIGYAPELADSGFHPLDGARYLRVHGWDEVICRLVAHHSDAATQADAHGLGDQLRREFVGMDGLPCDVLWTADATTGPNGERFTLKQRIDEIGNRYGSEHPVTVGMLKSRNALQAAIDRVAAASD